MKYLALCSWITFYILILLVVMGYIPEGRSASTGISLAIAFILGFLASRIDSAVETKK